MTAAVLAALLGLAPCLAADAPPKAKSRAGEVIDLGQLEVEGELRRPNVNWVDSQKRVREMIPELHRSEFRAMEEILLRPAGISDVAARLKRGEKHAGN